MRTRWNDALNQWVFRPFCWVLFRTIFPLRIEGAEILRHYPGPVILAGNHSSFLDGPILMTALRRPLLFLVTDEVFSWPTVGKFVQRGPIISLKPNHPGAGLRKATASLKAHQAVCIFPEGKLSTNGQLGHFYGGVAYLQAKSQAPIIPFVIHGAYEAWPWGKRFPTPHRLAIQFGAAVVHTSNTYDTLLMQLKDTLQRMKRNLEAREQRMTLRKTPPISNKEILE